MAIGHWAGQFSRTDTGLPAIGDVITVKNTGTNVGATLTDSSGTPLGVSTFLTDSRGNGGFYASDILGYDIYQGTLLVVSDVRVTDIGGGSFPGTYPLVNADIAAGAAIDESKIANLTTDLAGIGTYFKQAVQAATTVALPANTSTSGVLTATVNGTFPTVDGYTAVVGDRLLVKNEVAGANNGIYAVTNLGSASTKWVLTRAIDADGAPELNGGATVPVLNGTAQGGQQWTQTVKTVTVGTTAQVWSQSNNAGTQRRPGHFLVAASNANAVWKNQADYVCTGTADEVKINAALTALGANGGWVECSDGDFTCAASIVLKDNTRLTGQAWAVTAFHFPTDLGAGNYALFDSGTGIQLNAPFVQNVRIIGPSTSTTKGVAPASMHGVKLGRNWTMDSVWIQGFNSGIVVWGDHQILTHITSQLNYYGLDHLDGAPAGGNQYVAYSSFGGNNYASVRIDGGTSVIGATWRQVTLGSSPYGIYRTDKSEGGTATVSGVSDSLMDYVNFEFIGNAAIKDVSAGNVPFSDSTEWNHVGFGWDPSNKIAAEDANYAVNIQPFSGLWINSPINYGTSPFTIGALGTWLGAQGADFIQGQNRSRLWKGNGSNGNIASGNLVGLSGIDTVMVYDGLQPLVGVALTNWESLSSQRMTQVQFEGQVNVSSASTVAARDQLSVDPANPFQVHTRAPGEQPVGYALRAAASGLVTAWIRIVPPVQAASPVTIYAPTTTATKSTTSTTDAALDTTNLRVASVVAPSTGNLVVHVTLGKVTTGTGGGMFCIFANGARVGPHVFIPASTTLQNVPMLIKLTGLTAGTAYNIDLASHSVTSGQTTSLVIDDATTTTNTAGPTTIRVDPST